MILRKRLIFTILTASAVGQVILLPMLRLLYTGTNYDEVKRLCGDRVLAPYFCMGFSMLSVDTGEGFVSVNEGDTIVREDDGSLRIEK